MWNCELPRTEIGYRPDIRQRNHGKTEICMNIGACDLSSIVKNHGKISLVRPGGAYLLGYNRAQRTLYLLPQQFGLVLCFNKSTIRRRCLLMGIADGQPNQSNRYGGNYESNPLEDKVNPIPIHRRLSSNRLAADCYGSIVASFISFSVGYWLIYSAGLIKDVTCRRLAEVTLGTILILVSFWFVIHAMLDLAQYTELL